MSVRVRWSRSASILHPLQTHQCIFLSLSRSDFRSVKPTQRETGRVRPCPMESIRQHFTPSVNASAYFSKSLAIGLPLSRIVAYPRRSDSVRVYWTYMFSRPPIFRPTCLIKFICVLSSFVFDILFYEENIYTHWMLVRV